MADPDSVWLRISEARLPNSLAGTSKSQPSLLVQSISTYSFMVVGVPAGLEGNIKLQKLPAAGLLWRALLKGVRNKPFRSLAVLQDLFTSTALSTEDQ